jgi:hypothetical protein
VGLERGPLSLVSTIQEPLSGLDNREYGRRDPSCRPRGNLYLQKLALTSPTSWSRSVGIVRSPSHFTLLIACTYLFWYVTVIFLIVSAYFNNIFLGF